MDRPDVGDRVMSAWGKGAASMSELAVESASLGAGGAAVRRAVRNIGGVCITDMRVPADTRAGRTPCRIITLEGDPAETPLAALLKRGIERLLPKSGLILAVGLGNPDITRDSFGALTVRLLAPRRGVRYSLAAMETDVGAKTGIETARMVRAVARELRADCVLAADSLCCREPSRIYRTIQLSSAGITPGSGAEKARRELSAETVGIPVIACGVPSATLLSSVTGERRHSAFLAAPLDEDVQVRLWAECAAYAINSVISERRSN